MSRLSSEVVRWTRKTILGFRLLFSREGRVVWNTRLREFYFTQILQRRFPEFVPVHSFNGVRWLLPTKDPTSLWVYCNLDFDRQGMQTCLSLLKAGDTVVDAGAYYGYYSRLFANQLGETGRVIAIEAFEHTASILHAQVADLKKGLVTIVRAPLWSARVSLSLLSSPECLESCRRVVKQEEVAEGCCSIISACAVTLDVVLSENGKPQPSLVKLDVEGSETEVLKGGRQTFTSDSPPWLYIELNPTCLEKVGSSDQELLDLLTQQYGYKLAFYLNGAWGWVENRLLLSEAHKWDYINMLAKPPRGKFQNRGNALGL